jgi:hypothetical protein
VADNSFTAGDPWGLPIEEPDDLDIEESPGEGQHPDTSEEDSPGAEAGGFGVPTEHEEAPEAAGWDEPAMSREAESPEHDTPDDEDSWSPAEDYETPEDEPVTHFDDQEPESADDDFTFKAPTRTPLSQMIAAAQSVVSSVQGKESYEDVEEPPEAVEEPTPEEPVEPVADTSEEFAAEPSAMPLPPDTVDQDDLSTQGAPADDEDLPEEPPPWLIVGEQPVSEAVDEAFEDHTAEYRGDQAFTPEDIEESIAELASPEVDAPVFAEDHLEMATGEARDEILDDLDLDSSPGVYQELTDLGDQKDQAESLLQEAAVAFGREEQPFSTDESDEPADTFEPEEPAEPPSPEDLDTFADALATDLGGEETALEAGPQDAVELVEEPLVGADEIDSLAEALATGLGNEDTTFEPPAEDVQQWQVEEPDADGTDLAEPFRVDETEDEIDSLAEALATGLGTEAIVEEAEVDLEEADVESYVEEAEVDLEEADVESYVDDEELGEALAGLVPETEKPTARELEEADLEEAFFTIPERDESQTAPEIEPAEAFPVDAVVEPTEEAMEPVMASESEDFLEAGAAEPTTPVEPDPAGASLIESPVAWGTDYREAQQGWVDDEEGRSTWRPIVTSGEAVAGWELDTYLGLVSGDVSFQPDGPESTAVGIASARDDATRQMLDEALTRGAHAVVSVTFSIQEVAGVVVVSASGVAVTLRAPA